LKKKIAHEIEDLQEQVNKMKKAVSKFYARNPEVEQNIGEDSLEIMSQVVAVLERYEEDSAKNGQTNDWSRDQRFLLNNWDDRLREIVR